jgi:hypothetical protein
MNWRPINTAPKGGSTETNDTRDPRWVEPPLILLLFENGKAAVCYWDWYYAEGGNGYDGHCSAWIEAISGEQIAMHYDEPTHWFDYSVISAGGE